MGTNYYLMTRNKSLIREHFGDGWGEYEIVDEPYLGYEIHLNKCSGGWRPLFQRHKAFKTFRELERFYLDHAAGLEIYDEYNEKYSWDSYKEIILNHMSVEPRPLRWVYDIDPIDKITGGTKKHVRTENCLPEEAELWIPIDHILYFQTKKEAYKRFGQYYWMHDMDLDFKYWNDPDYPIDWTDGWFS